MPSGSGTQPSSRVAGGVTKTRRVAATPSPQAGWLAESWRHAKWQRRPAPERGGWLSHGVTPSGSGAQPPNRVAGGVTETHQVATASSPRTGWLAESRRHTEWYGAQPLSRVAGGITETRRVAAMPSP